MINPIDNEMIGSFLENLGEPVIDKVLDKAGQQIDKFVQLFKLQANDQLHAFDVDFLNKEKLTEIAKKFIVEGSKEVAAFKNVKNNKYIIYLAYTADKELLPEDKNNYIIVESKALAPDLMELFANEQYIILK